MFSPSLLELRKHSEIPPRTKHKAGMAFLTKPVNPGSIKGQPSSTRQIPCQCSVPTRENAGFRFPSQNTLSSPSTLRILSSGVAAVKSGVWEVCRTGLNHTTEADGPRGSAPPSEWNGHSPVRLHHVNVGSVRLLGSKAGSRRT